MTQPTPTERKLTREQIEAVLTYEPGNGWQNGFVQRLAASWLEQNAALDEVRANHDPNIRGEDWCGLYGYAVRKRNCPICDLDKVLP